MQLDCWLHVLVQILVKQAQVKTKTMVMSTQMILKLWTTLYLSLIHIFERSFMNMAFGDQVSCTVKDLFKNYEFSDDVYKHAKKADQDAIRSLGSKAQARFDTAVNLSLIHI